MNNPRLGWIPAIAITALMLVMGCQQLPHARNAQTTFPAGKLQAMDEAIGQAIADKKCPGGVLWLERGQAIYHRAYGNRALVPAVEQMTEDTIFDAASLTKVVAATPAIMLLIERGMVGLEDPVAKYIPEFTGGGKETVTVRQLLTHTSGLRPDIETRSDWTGQSTAIRKACEEQLQTPPGTALRYSDINFFLLGEIASRVARTPLETFVQQQVYTPLGMKDSSFLPPQSKLARVAPTEVVNGKPYRGVVHDPTARKMGGVAGHAGLFTTAADLARYARMLLNEGSLDGVRIFKPETVRLMTRVQTPDTIPARRGLGWDIDSNYSSLRGGIFPLGSYGHTGWTGTSLWIDPFSRTFVIFLSNRNHPDESGNVIPLRVRLGTLAAEAVSGFNFTNVPGALKPRPRETTNSAIGPVLNGIDVLARNRFAPLKGLRLGLITNHTGHDRDRNPTIDLLKNAPGIQLKALFSPEHGIRGAQDEKIGDSIDEKTGLPVYSLYGKVQKPQPQQLKDIDALVYDIQDIGCRFYTYTSTMGLALEAAGENNLPIFVLDRVNPIDGATIDGPVLSGKTSFVGFHPIPLRYGMTIGELARMFNAERNSKARLTVIPLEQWKRSYYMDETGLPWTNPSPNMRNLTEAILYPGIGLLESALSVGRGTDTPFEIVGAPYIDDVRLAKELSAANLPGVRFVPVRFTPKASIHKDKACGGVYILLTDRHACNVVDVGLEIALTLQKLYPADFKAEKISHLLLHPATLEAIKTGKPLADIRASWKDDLKEFEQRRAKYLLY
ncbi:MAG: DUF1343 domain-containing protein [Verrucomicrobia bacterium]|jgi:uncharacterized protein YbbC (DUF1343 family)/CubicO group peptidase (beta-lactamase class C family)|nr:DUF1343 domain-containing protein [Verrucomicrobiota bacterium]